MHMGIHIPRGMIPMLVMFMDLFPVQTQLTQTTAATLIRMSQQVLIPMFILILHLRLPQRPYTIIHIHTLILRRLLIYHTHPHIHILQRRHIRTTHIHTHMIRSLIHIQTRMSRGLIRIHIRRPLSSLMHILIHIYPMTIHPRINLGPCRRATTLEGQ